MSTEFKDSCNTDLALKIVLFSSVVILGAMLIYQLKMLIVCLIIAITLASAIVPFAEVLEKRKIPRLVSVLFLYLLAAMIYAMVAALLLPTIHEQWSKLSDNLPEYLSGLWRWYHGALHAAGDQARGLAINADDVRSLSLRLLQHSLNMTAGLLGLIINAIFTLFLSAYFVVESNGIWSAIFRWVPPAARDRVSQMIPPLASRMGGYVRGQLLVALAVAMFLSLAFLIAGIRYGLVLGILGGLFNLVPYVGSLLACVFAAVVAFNQTPLLVLAVLVIYGVEQWVETAFMVPFFLGNNTSLHPLVVMLAIIIGGTLMGVPGALVAVPLTSAVLYLGEEFYAKRINHKSVKEVASLNQTGS